MIGSGTGTIRGWVGIIQTTELLRLVRILRVQKTWRDFLSIKLQWETIIKRWREKRSKEVYNTTTTNNNNDNNNNNNNNAWRKLKLHIFGYFGGWLSIKQVHMKDKIRKEYLRRTRKLLETKLSSRNLIKGINTWAISLVRYSVTFLNWTRDELKQIDQRKRKLMTMHKPLHPREDFDKLYVSRKEGGRGLASIGDSFDASIRRLEDHIEKPERGLITAIRNNMDNTTE